MNLPETRKRRGLSRTSLLMCRSLEQTPGRRVDPVEKDAIRSPSSSASRSSDRIRWCMRPLLVCTTSDSPALSLHGPIAHPELEGRDEHRPLPAMR